MPSEANRAFEEGPPFFVRLDHIAYLVYNASYVTVRAEGQKKLPLTQRYCWRSR